MSKDIQGASALPTGLLPSVEPLCGVSPPDGASIPSARQRAWATRRAKYGQRGHSGSYRTSPLRQSEAAFKVEMARQNISQARRQCQIMLPDQAAHIAITRLDIADDLLCHAFMPTLSAASAIEARRAETGTGSVHESAGPQDDAQPASDQPHAE